MKSREFLFCLFSSLAVMPLALEAEVAPADDKPKGDLPIILKLAQRDRLVTVKSDGGMTLYTVETLTGEVIVRDRKLDDLRATDPKLYDLVKRAVAGPEGGILDASNSRGEPPKTAIR